MTNEECFTKCIEDDKFCILLSRIISKKASRQGIKDETEQLRICNITSQQYNINIINLSQSEYRPTKDGQILSKKEIHLQNISMDNCLKSFDGLITGKINGFISAKIAYGSGGHQDNVFEEMDIIAEWWKKYINSPDYICVLLIDTDLIAKFTRLKEKYADINNILVKNHIEFQQYIIDNYNIEERI